jgi:hypothetical protein
MQGWARWQIRRIFRFDSMNENSQVTKERLYILKREKEEEQWE